MQTTSKTTKRGMKERRGDEKYKWMSKINFSMKNNGAAPFWAEITKGAATGCNSS